MTKDQAINEAMRRSRIKVTTDGAMERIYVWYPANLGAFSAFEFRASRWLDIPRGSFLTACYHNAKPQTSFEPENK